ncbi:hypothetical protein [Lewinella sp. IMCC34183]|uniref:hypothetical protein n=1 Tax=Lewinella sp. IMCC34183 TaxID=2248762 RepID=UPI000E275ABA|nr:hypothetical protein [Lewinella sp. IMCC34183]
MFVRTIFAALLVCACSLSLSAQAADAVGEASPAGEASLAELARLRRLSRVVYTARYDGVRGTPYRYEEFRPGVVFDNALNRYALDSLNFNGFTNQFEYVIFGQLRELPQQNFLRADLDDGNGGRHVYAFGINPRFPTYYAELVYQGDFVTATMIYDVTNDVKVIQDVGRTMRLRRFDAKSLYFAYVDGEFVSLRLQPRRLAADLGHRGPLRRFMEDGDLDPSRRDDLLEILSFAERLYLE